MRRALEHDLAAALQRHLPAAVALRRTIHADPRISGDERATTKLMVEAIGSEGEWVEEGMVFRFGDPQGGAIAIRAELDALPIPERTGVSWASTSGISHVCGHDVHLAALSAVIHTLRDVGFDVPLVAVLQPREETLPCGAADMVGSSSLLRHDIRAFLGVHLQPRLPDGEISAAAGAVNASSDEVSIVLHGRPSHGAYPQLSRDPVVASSALIQALQHLVSRRSDPMNPTVLTLGMVQGGSSYNAIPSEVRLKGMVRTFDMDFRGDLENMIQQVCKGIAMAYDCTADVTYEFGEPVMMNDPILSEVVTESLVASGHVNGVELRSCGADDFAFYGTRFPALMIFAGTGDGDPNTPGLHHPQFLPPDAAVEQVARVMLTAYAAVSEHLSVKASADPSP